MRYLGGNTMGFFKRLFNSGTRSPEVAKLRETVLALVKSESWTNAKSIIVQHPELLSDDAVFLLKGLIRDEDQKIFNLNQHQAFGGDEDRLQQIHQNVDMLKRHLEQLCRCRVEGVELAFDLLTHPEILRELPSILSSFIEVGCEPQWKKNVMDQHPELSSEELDALLESLISDTRKQIVKQHPELLSKEADMTLELMVTEAENQNDTLFANRFKECRALLCRCREEGVEAALTPQLRSCRHEQPMGSSPEIPSEFVADLGEVLSLSSKAESDLRFHGPQVKAIENILQQLGTNRYSSFRASLLIELGNSYMLLPEGGRAENLLKAITCYEEALTFYTPEAYPVDYVLTKNNLGNVYRHLAMGDPAKNLEKAIECYAEALPFATDQTTSLRAMTLNNIGNAYMNFPIRDRKVRTKYIRKAIDCYEEVFRYRTREIAPRKHANAINNLGTAYIKLRGDDWVENLKKAIALFREALTILTPEKEPFEYASIQANMGSAYLNLSLILETSNFQQINARREKVPSDFPISAMACACYEDALRILTPEAAPTDCRRVAFDLANFYFRESYWEMAHKFYEIAIRAGVTLYQAAGVEVCRQSELAEMQDLFSCDAYCLARCGRYEKAVEQLESGRTRMMAEALARDHAALKHATEEDRQAFEEARGHVRALESETRTMDDDVANAVFPEIGSFIQISANLRTARNLLTEIIQRIRGYVPAFMPEGLAFDAITSVATSSHPLNYLITTSQGTLALIVPNGVQELREEHALWLDDLESEDLNDLLFREDAEGNVINGYLLGQTNGDPQLLKAALDQALPVLEERLVEPLGVRLRDLGFEQAILIPCGRLSALPLHAAAFQNEITFSYAPSARTLQAVKMTAAERTAFAPLLLAVGNPLPLPSNAQPLAFAGTEINNIKTHFAVSSQRVLYEYKAVRAVILDALQDATHLHFACHATFDADAPLDSALIFSDGEKLTLHDLLDGNLNLSSARLAVLSGCQTGVTDFRKVPDEVIGLAAGFLQAGVPGVLSTLWPIDDLSTALLISRFYQYHLKDGLNPAVALKQAQKWLCTSTAQEIGLSDYPDECFQEDREGREQAFQVLQCKPFAHPYYWAAFIFAGAVDTCELDVKLDGRNIDNLEPVIKSHKDVELKNILFAIECIDNNDFEKANILCERVLAKHPNNRLALQLSSIIARKFGDYMNATYLLEQACVIPIPDDISEEEMEIMKRVSDLEVDMMTNTYNIGPEAIAYTNMAAECGNDQHAEELLLKSLQICPNYDLTYYNLAVIAYNKGNYQQAIQYLTKAVTINPTYKKALDLLNKITNWDK